MRYFGQSRHCIGTISGSMLSKQFKELTNDGFFECRKFGEAQPRVEYTLTARGSFVPILLAMKEWGERELGL